MLIPRENTGIEKDRTSRKYAGFKETRQKSHPDRKSISTRNSYNFCKALVRESCDQGSKKIVKSPIINPDLESGTCLESRPEFVRELP
jgi:hypothetical protein